MSFPSVLGQPISFQWSPDFSITKETNVSLIFLPNRILIGYLISYYDTQILLCSVVYQRPKFLAENKGFQYPVFGFGRRN